MASNTDPKRRLVDAEPTRRTSGRGHEGKYETSTLDGHLHKNRTLGSF